MSWLRDLVVRIKGDKTQLDSTLKGAEGSVNTFGATVKRLGGIIAAAFSVGAIISFSKEAAKLAAEAEGVKNAFMKIGSARSVLEDMKRATRGVIDESDLMALAVKAQNFNIPLKDLSKYLEFATNRAITTGKSIADLTELIVTGLGRKSSRSFIELGLTADGVQKAFKETNGMLNLVTESLNKMGPVADTAIVRYERLATNAKNLKEAWGDFINASPAIQKTISDLSQTLDNMAAKAEMKKDKRLPKGVWQIMTPDEYRQFLAQEKFIDERIAKMKTTPVNSKTGKPYLSYKDWQPEEIAVKTIADLRKELTAGEAAIETFTESEATQLQIQLKANEALKEKIRLLTTIDETIKRATPITPANISNLSIGQLAPTPGAADTLSGAPVFNAITEGLDESQQALISLADTFAGFFSDVNLGFQGMIDGVITGIKRLVAELVAKAVILAILSVLFPGSAVPLTMTNILGGNAGALLKGGSAGKTSSLGSAAPTGMSQSIKIMGNTVIQGKDLAVVWTRYNENNS
jgi:hypothetical protein